MTPCSRIYKAFLSRILEDEWENWLQEEAEEDWYEIMEAAITWFKFPRIDLTHTKEGFDEDLTNQEIQIIANYMKCEWLNRCIMTWENIKPLYEEKDFSQANLIDKLTKALKEEREKAKIYESYYYRSVNGKPYKYSSLAGSVDEGE